MKTTKSLAIQSLKGLCAIVVLLGHVTGAVNDEWVNVFCHSAFNVFRDGTSAVLIFFAITGFFHYRKTDNAEFLNTYKGGVIRKLCKLYPSYWIAVTLGWILCNLQLPYPTELYSAFGNQFWSAPVSLKDYLFTMSMVHLGDPNLIDFPIWYLNVEIKMVFVMPLVVWLIRQYGWSVAVVLFFASVIPSKIPFGFGFLFAYLGGTMVRKAIEECPSWRAWLCGASRRQLAVMVAVGLLMYDFYNIAHIDRIHAPHILYTIQVMGIMLILPVVYLRAGKWMEHPLLVYLGNRSYQIYLLHAIVMLTLRPLGLSVISYLFATLAITLVLSEGLYQLDGRINRWVTPKVERIFGVK